MFEDRIKGQLDTLKKLDRLPKKGLYIVIDMHLIPRYDMVTWRGADPFQIQKRNRAL